VKKDKSAKLGNISMFLSLACAIHCAATPVLVVLVSLMGVGFMMDPFWEVLILCISNVLAIIALGTSYRHHQQKTPFLIFGISLLFIIPGLYVHNHFFIFTGALLTASALYLNWRISKKTSHTH